MQESDKFQDVHSILNRWEEVLLPVSEQSYAGQSIIERSVSADAVKYMQHLVKERRLLSLSSAMDHMRQKHPEVPTIVVENYVDFLMQNVNKKEAHAYLKIDRIRRQLFHRYQKSAARYGANTIVRLAEEERFSPFILARSILLELVTRNPTEAREWLETEPMGEAGEELEACRSTRMLPSSPAEIIKHLMEDPGLIPDTTLRAAVCKAMTFDDFNGPCIDADRHYLGEVYEQHLYTLLQRCQITFLNEYDQRLLHTEKTPDVLLIDEIEIDGQRIKWIDSKAMFADEEIHKHMCHKQLIPYCEMFGPGLVIYWLGHVEGLSNPAPLLTVRTSLPETFQVSRPKELEFDEEPFTGWGMEDFSESLREKLSHMSAASEAWEADRLASHHSSLMTSADVSHSSTQDLGQIDKVLGEVEELQQVDELTVCSCAKMKAEIEDLGGTEEVLRKMKLTDNVSDCTCGAVKDGERLKNLDQKELFAQKTDCGMLAHEKEKLGDVLEKTLLERDKGFEIVGVRKIDSGSERVQKRATLRKPEDFKPGAVADFFRGPIDSKTSGRESGDTKTTCGANLVEGKNVPWSEQMKLSVEGNVLDATGDTITCASASRTTLEEEKQKRETVLRGRRRVLVQDHDKVSASLSGAPRLETKTEDVLTRQGELETTAEKHDAVHKLKEAKQCAERDGRVVVQLRMNKAKHKVTKAKRKLLL